MSRSIPMQPKKILVVDDDEIIRTLISNALTSAGYEVFTAEDASSAISQARLQRPDLVTLDIELPFDSPGDTWDGFSVAGWLQRLNEDKRTPFVVIAGGDPAKVGKKAAAMGAYAFLPKPVGKGQLLAVVAEALK